MKDAEPRMQVAASERSGSIVVCGDHGADPRESLFQHPSRIAAGDGVIRLLDSRSIGAVDHKCIYRAANRL
jgi:hypothetical protein